MASFYFAVGRTWILKKSMLANIKFQFFMLTENYVTHTGVGLWKAPCCTAIVTTMAEMHLPNRILFMQLETDHICRVL